MINLCLAVGVDSSMTDKKGVTAFDISCQAPDEKISTLFYKHVFDVEKSDADAALLQLLTPTSEPEDGPEFPGDALFGPMIGNNQPRVKVLMKSRVNLTTTNSNTETVIHLAAKHGHTQILSTLLKNSSRGVSVDVEAVSKDGLMPLHYAAQDRHGETVADLLNQGADAAAKDSNGGTARDSVVDNVHNGAQLALDVGSRNQTALHRAAAARSAGRLQQLLDGGDILEARNQSGLVPLHLAALGGHSESVELLLDRGADREATGSSNMTALISVNHRGHPNLGCPGNARDLIINNRSNCFYFADTLHFRCRCTSSFIASSTYTINGSISGCSPVHRLPVPIPSLL